MPGGRQAPPRGDLGPWWQRPPGQREEARSWRRESSGLAEDAFLAHSPSPSSTSRAYALSLERRHCTPMKLKIRNSKSKKAKKTGFLSRQRTSGGRKVNKRHRSRHGSF